MAPSVLTTPAVPAPSQGPALTQVETITSSNAPNAFHPHPKIKHRSSKPILAWVQRKLTAAASGATGKTHQHKDSQNLSGTSGGQSTGNEGQYRRASGPEPSLSLGSHYQRRHNHRKHTDTYASRSSQRSRSLERASMGMVTNKDMRRMAVRNQQHSPGPFGSSIGGADVQTLSHRGSESAPPSPHSGSLSFSGAPGSTWSNPPEADDDASIRPLPPTSPPSPAPSRSTHYTISSYTSGGGMSDPRTFRSGAASTKPTTLLSIDVGPQIQGMAHIAQAPPSTTGGSVSAGPGTAPSSPSFGRFPRGHAQVPSVASITFSNLPAGPRHPLASALSPETDYEALIRREEEEEDMINHAPNMSHYHPRNNPRPSSPPLDNASTYTLASSTYAMPHRQHGPPSVVSRFPASVSVSLHGGPRSLSGLDPGLYDGDGDASVRALRPRSRAGSWGSMASTETGWSAAVHALGPSTRRVPGAGSMRTADDVDDEGSIRYGPMEEIEEIGSGVGNVRLDDSVVTTIGGPAPASGDGHKKRPGSLTLDSGALKPDATNDAQPGVGIMLTVPTPDQSRIATPLTEEGDSIARQPVEKESEKPPVEKVQAKPTAAEEVRAEARRGDAIAPVAVAVPTEKKEDPKEKS
ncbi:hypothetical protein FRC04_007562 [Tulasnella sp. 424]|nr:hypothetical protein FRC04_007562 [Tulasnella sp. 424]KAG8978997.1 hypothetical protein FRC05_009207 [Tulasnella sp. 425]